MFREILYTQWKWSRLGLMAVAVLRNWNIRQTGDFGAVVFAMVEAGWMAKNDNDSIDFFAY